MEARGVKAVRPPEANREGVMKGGGGHALIKLRGCGGGVGSGGRGEEKGGGSLKGVGGMGKKQQYSA